MGRTATTARHSETEAVMFWWGLLGALIGVAAAQRKGFSTVGGVLGGLLLGPLAILMFFMSGIFSSDESRKCPECAEFVKGDAKKCKHCGSELPPLSVTKSGAATSGASARQSARPVVST